MYERAICRAVRVVGGVLQHNRFPGSWNIIDHFEAVSAVSEYYTHSGS